MHIRSEADRIKGSVFETKVPISVITGFLGSGKSTFLNYVLKGNHGKKIAIILNEFAENTEEIEKEMIISSSKGESAVTEWLTLPNGCICCSVKGKGLRAIEDLVTQNKYSDKFDMIFLETSGLADVGSVAKMFWVDDGALSDVELDGIITVVDASRFEKNLNDQVISETYSSQIIYADCIILNKIDLLANNADLDRIIDSIASINQNATVITTSYSQVPDLGSVINLKSFSEKPQWLKIIGTRSLLPTKTNRLGDIVSTLSVKLKEFNDALFMEFEHWIQSSLWSEYSFQIMRSKCLLFNIDSASWYILQSIDEIYEVRKLDQSAHSKASFNDKTAVLSIIGRNLESMKVPSKFCL